MRELKYPSPEVINELKKIRQKRKKPYFDSKTQVDLNALWVISLLKAHKVLPNLGYLKMAENFYDRIEKKISNKIHHSYSKDLVFLEDYAFLINALLDLYDSTLNIRYKIKAKDLSEECIKNFYLKEKYFPKKSSFNK